MVATHICSASCILHTGVQLLIRGPASHLPLSLWDASYVAELHTRTHKKNHGCILVVCISLGTGCSEAAALMGLIWKEDWKEEGGSGGGLITS
jgi:hypothetical protein